MKLMPQEVEVRYILPTIRKEFTLELSRRGLSQKEIASILKLTPAAVSQYLSSKRASYISLKDNKDIKNSITKIIDKKSNPHQEMYSLSKKFIEDKTICKIHKQFDKHVPEDCKICLKN